MQGTRTQTQSPASKSPGGRDGSEIFSKLFHFRSALSHDLQHHKFCANSHESPSSNSCLTYDRSSSANIVNKIRV
eukprot:337897-Rhodomonas_salina.4